MSAAHLGSYLFLALFVYIFLSFADGQCNSCSMTNNLACVSKTEFQFCIDGTPVGGVNSCPDGYVCSIDDPIICHLNSDNVVVACGGCNVCDSNGIFACTGVQTYALCLGSTIPSALIYTCPTNFVCNIELPQICGDTTLGVTPTCPTAGQESTTTPPTTISPITYPQRYCRNLGQYGRFPVGNSTDSTCRQYVFCFSNFGNWTGQLYTCPGRTYFNSTSRLCVDEVPENCEIEIN